ncbi:MAG: hypothetical protein PHR78_06835, partial [Eubacteriales bacterium]|nr:hypothetical protein [Eubacteriales bacterium]
MSSELITRIRTGVIIVLVMLLFLVPGYWLPFMPLILFLAITYLSAAEKGRAISRRMPTIGVMETAITSVLLVLPMFFVIPDGWFVRGIPAASAPLAATIIAPRLFSAFALVLLIVGAIWVLAAALKKGVERLPFSVFEIFIIARSAVPLASLITLFYGI